MQGDGQLWILCFVYKHRERSLLATNFTEKTKNMQEKLQNNFTFHFFCAII